MKKWLVAFIATVTCVVSLGLLAAPVGAASTSTTTVIDNATGVVTGGTFTFTATVASAAGTPTGALTWTVTDPVGHAVTCADSTLDGAGQATCTIAGAIAGTYSATANYVGDTNYDPSSGSDTTATVGKAVSTTTVSDDSAGKVTGDTLQFTATVTGPGGAPAGTVAWTGVTCSSTTPLTAGVATCSILNAQASIAYNATANFTDTDGNYNDSSNSDAPVSPAKAPSTTTLTNNAGSVSSGGTLVFTATVTGPGGTPVGTVTWTGSACTASPLSAGVATCSISNAQAGTPYNETATFTDTDGNYNDSNYVDSPVSLALANQAPLVVTSTAGTYGTALTLTTSGGSGTGAVSYTVVNGTALGCAVVLTDQLTSTSAGTCLVTATKAADASYNATSSAQTAVTLALAPSTTAVTDNSGSVVTGGTLTFTATVTGSGGAPTGTVAWTGVTCNSTTPLTLGLATCSILNAQASIAYGATATFTDTDGNHSGSAASATANVGKATPSAPTITNLPGSGTFGGGFTAGVFTANGDGTLSVTSSTPAVCTTSGVTVSYVGVGICSLNAQVAAGPNYTAASGGAQSFNIGRANATTPVITNIPSPANEFAGFTVNLATTGDGTMSVTSNTTAVCSVDPNGITVSFVGFGTCSLTPSVAQGPNHFGATGNPQAFTVKAASHGYWLVGSDGGIFSFGTATFFGSTGSIHLQRPVVGITPTSTRNGYWLVASDGGIFSFGDSSFYGSIPGVGLNPAGSGLPNSLNAPIVGMVPTLTGRGYFMVASDGGVFSFGDARFEGSCPGIGGCSSPAVTVIPDHSGNGYWVVTTSGGVYAFGDAPFYGSGPLVAVPVVDAVATPSGNGYWLLYANGAVAAFGAATALGGPIGYVNSFNPATAIFRTADGFGYWVAAARGDVFGYGSAPYLGGMAAAGLNGEIIAAFGF